MGFFKKSVPSKSKSTALTIIAKGNKITGDLTITGKLHIDGCIEGSINSIDDVSIGKSGQVIGNIVAKNITVSGLLEGGIECQHIHLAAGSRVLASITSTELTMDAKSQFIGERRESSDLQLNLLSAAQINTVDAVEPSKVKKATADKFDNSVETTAEDSIVSDDTLKSEAEAATGNAEIIDNLPDKVTLDVAEVDKAETDIHNLSSEGFSDQNLSFLMDSLNEEVAEDAVDKEQTKPESTSSNQLNSEVLDIDSSEKTMKKPSGRAKKPLDMKSATAKETTQKSATRVTNISNKKQKQNNSKVVNEKTTVLELKF